MTKENSSRFSDDPNYQALDPKVQEMVDYFDKHYDDPYQVALNMLAYIEKHQQAD